MGDVVDLTADSPAAKTAKRSAGAAAASGGKSVRAVKKPKPATGFVLLWIPFTCKGGRKTKVMGVFASKEKAQEAKNALMTSDNTYGHGDICVGGTWEDEISLVILKAPLHLDE